MKRGEGEEGKKRSRRRGEGGQEKSQIQIVTPQSSRASCWQVDCTESVYGLRLTIQLMDLQCGKQTSVIPGH